MPETFFKSFIAKKPCAVVFPYLHMQAEPSKSYVDFNKRRFWLSMTGTISLLEKALLEKSSESSFADRVRQSIIEKGISQLEESLRGMPQEYIQLAEFVMRGALSQRKELIAEQILPSKSFFALSGRIYPLFEGGQNASIADRRYSLGLTPSSSIEELESKYLKAIEAEKRKKAAGIRLEAMQALKEKQWLDKNKNIGFRLVKDRFYAFTKVEPYILFERLNNAYYEFPEAEAGIPLFLNQNSIDFGRLYVLNSYSHPSISSFDTPMQAICAGSYDYEAAKRRHSSPYAVLEELMEKARTVLREEYRSRGKPYYFLTNQKFDKFKTTYFNEKKVANIG
ncbi:MAG: hypothetical protein QME12_06005 [Nanoarchaeota archaeon]|nr:hypothetical protein [Nanoarchaeota archaeon]